MGAAEFIEVEYELERLEHMPETGLWASAMKLFVQEAYAVHVGKTVFNTDPSEAQRSYEDLLRCGPQTRRLCRHLACNPVWVSEQFTKRCASLK